jgi:hypothetical protein
VDRATGSPGSTRRVSPEPPAGGFRANGGVSTGELEGLGCCTRALIQKKRSFSRSCTSGAGVSTRGTSYWGHPPRVKRPISPSFPALAAPVLPATRPSYSISPPLAPLPDPPAPKSLPLPSPALHTRAITELLLLFLLFLLSSFRRASSAAVSPQPSQTRSCPTPSPPEEPDTLASAPSWPFARPPPKRGGSRRCSTSPKGREYQVPL